MSTPRVLVSILNFNGGEKVLRTIKCFRAQTYPNFDLQVVDNGSAEDCIFLIRSRFPDLPMMELGENTGFGGGNNHALEQALREDYDYALICNHDVILDEHFLTRLIESAEARPECGVMGVVEEDCDTGSIRAVGGKNVRLWRGKGHWIRNLPKGDDPVIEVDYVQGALTLFSRRALEAGIQFDSKLFLYCDEMDLYFQLKKASLKAYVDTRNRLKHERSQKPFNLLQGYYIHRNRFYLSRKYGSRFVFTVAILLGIVELAVKGLIRAIQGYPQYSWICFLGFLDALQNQMGVGRRSPLS